jgi:hypothetical protein
MFMDNPYAVAVISGLIIASIVGLWMIFRNSLFPVRPKSESVSSSTVHIGPSAQVTGSGSVLANAGTMGDVHIGDKIVPVHVEERRAEAVRLLLQNVRTGNKRLRDIIKHVDAGHMTSPELRQALADARDEFHRERARMVLLPLEDLEAVEQWHDDIRSTKDSISNEESAWMTFMNTSPLHPEGSHIPPGRKRLGDYRDLLARGERLESDVRALSSGEELPKGGIRPPDLEIARVALLEHMKRIIRTLFKIHAKTEHSGLPDRDLLAELDNDVREWKRLLKWIELIPERDITKHIDDWHREVKARALELAEGEPQAHAHKKVSLLINAGSGWLNWATIQVGEL